MRHTLGGSYIPNMKSLEEPVPHSPWPARGLCIAGLALIALKYVAMYAPGMDNLYVHYWPYLALDILPLICFVAAIFWSLYTHIQKRIASKIALFTGIGLVAFGLVFTFALCSSVEAFMDHPVAYYSSPEKTRRFVVMQSYTDQDQPAYTVYPMVNKYFYNANAGQGMSTKNGIDLVEWQSEDVAAVHMLDNDEQETVFIIDFNNPIDNRALELEQAEAEQNAD